MGKCMSSKCLILEELVNKFGSSSGKFCEGHDDDLGPVVQSIVSLTSSLRGQLVKFYDFITKYTEIFC